MFGLAAIANPRDGTGKRRGLVFLIALLSLAFTGTARSADLMIYEDALASGWESWSWNTILSPDATRKVTGASSLAVAYTAGWAGLSFRTDIPIQTAGYASLRFAVNGRASSGKLYLFTQPTDEGEASRGFEFTPTPNAWQEITVPLSVLGNPQQIARINLMDWTGAVQPTYNLDTLRLIAKPLPALTLTLDAAAMRQPISPLIYGINGDDATAADAAFMKSLGITVRRWGGNNTSRYNWRLDASNTANDWYFENVRMSNATRPPGDSATNRLIAQDRSSKVETVLTVPLIGYVAKNGNLSTCGFGVAKYGPQAETDPWRPNCGNGVKTDGQWLTGNDPADTSLKVDPSFARDWVKYLANRYGMASKGGVRYYNLDNEPDIWWSTHRDVAPVGLKYDQLRDRTYQYAAAIKAADPSAQTLGPVAMGWTYYWHSPWDGQREDWASPDDRNAHGGTPLVPWYLQQMRAYQQAHGQRLLDFLDLHYYPAAPHVALADAGDAATQALRLRSTRSLWDPTYVDESWIAAAGPAGGIVQLIPRMRGWVNANYPGTKLAITEYNWGAPEHINGALAQADVLGIFGREGVHLATLWSPPATNQPVAFAFRMFRNYNGAGGKFGETRIQAVSSDQSRLAIYAAEEAATGALTLIVINKTGVSLSAPLTLQNFIPTGTLQGWRYGAARLNQIVRLADMAITGVRFTVNTPANSITLYRVPGRRS